MRWSTALLLALCIAVIGGLAWWVNEGSPDLFHTDRAQIFSGEHQSPDTTTTTVPPRAPALEEPAAEIPSAPPHIVRRQFHNDPFLRGMRSPQELAQVIETNLAADPSGHTMLNPQRCEQDGSCATPADYLAMFQQNDQEAGLTSVAELPAFLRSLVQRTAEPGEYFMACLQGNAHTPVMHCMHRSFTTGESVWVDARSNRYVLAENCTNPVERPVVVPPCMEIMVTIREENSMKFAHLGPQPGPEQCLSLRKVGSGTIELAQYHGTCDFTAAAAFFREPVQEEYCVPVTSGTYILTVSRTPYGEAGTRDWWVFCWSRYDRGPSNTMRVRDFDYIGNAVRRATIYNSRRDMEQNTYRDGPSHLWIPWDERPGTDR